MLRVGLIKNFSIFNIMRFDLLLFIEIGMSTESMTKPKSFIFGAGFKIDMSEYIKKLSLQSKRTVVLTCLYISVLPVSI